MESIMKFKRFLAVETGSGMGVGAGIGHDSGSGSGAGVGTGYGTGSGVGTGYGFDAGPGTGSGFGRGTGYGFGTGPGTGPGTGFGAGNGNLTKIKSICGELVHDIDGVPTIIRQVFGAYAKGAIVMDDMTTKPCNIAKRGNTFAHGSTLREAVAALQDKLFEDMPEEERIDAFLEAHPDNGPYANQDLFQWHNKLTGSCLAGRYAFVANHEIDLKGSSTLSEFIELTKASYGGDVIRRLGERAEKGGVFRGTQ